MKFFSILLILFLISCSTASKTNDYYISFSDTTSGKELIGYKNKSGKIVIQPKYMYVFTDTLVAMAIVLKNGELIGIDKHENELLKPFIYDNGPDYIKEGLFRFVENNKIGFADSNGNKIIKAKYDFVTPFTNGIAEYTLGGYKQFDSSGEHWRWSGGLKNGYITPDGKEFVKVSDLKNNKREAWTKNKEHFILNEKGDIIKQIN